MKTVILDTNFLVLAGKIDFKSEISRICDFNYEIKIIDKTIGELKKIGKKADLALQLIDKFSIGQIKTNINKSVNIISLNYNFFTSLISLLFVLTHNELHLSLLANVFIVGLFIDFIYTILYYPNYVDPLLIMFHHPFYIFFTFYTIIINKVNLLAFFLLQEIPAVILSIKRYYNIKNIKIDYLFGFLFLLFRIIYHLYISYYFKDEIIDNKILLFVVIILFDVILVEFRFIFNKLGTLKFETIYTLLV